MSGTAQNKAASAAGVIRASSARACITVTLRQPSSAIRSQATAAICGDSWMPTTPPRGPTLSRSRPQHSPVPHPRPGPPAPGPAGAPPPAAAGRAGIRRYHDHRKGPAPIGPLPGSRYGSMRCVHGSSPPPAGRHLLTRGPASSARGLLSKCSWLAVPGDISGGAVPDLSQSRCANKSLSLCTGRPKTRPGFALGSPRSSWCRSDQVLICGNATRKFLILVVFYPVKPAARAFAGVPLLWPGTDVLLDPGDDHGGIVSPGTVVHDDAHRANVPWRRNGCARARRTLNSRQSAETTPTATPRCPSVLSPLLRCPCSPGPGRLPRALRPGAPHRASLALRHLLSDQAALRLQGPQHAFAPELAAATRSGAAGHGRPGGGRAGRSLVFRERCRFPDRRSRHGRPANGTGDVG